jgi:hypothetical protein
MMVDSAELGKALGSAGATIVFMWVAWTQRLGHCPKNSFNCSSRTLAGDFPEGSLWSKTSNTFAFTEFVVQNQF